MSKKDVVIDFYPTPELIKAVGPYEAARYKLNNDLPSRLRFEGKDFPKPIVKENELQLPLIVAAFLAGAVIGVCLSYLVI